MLMSKKIALIGGAGFIGHNLAITLKKKGHEPVIIDNLAINNMLSFTDSEIKNRNLYWSLLNQRLELLHMNEININIQDGRNYNALSMLIGKIKPDVIIQLAAVSHADKSNKDPHTTFDHTLRTLENSLDIAKSLGIHLIYFSSSMAYGNFNGESVNEEMPCNPIGIYGTLKYAGELIVKAYHEVFGLPYTIIRPSALYGERCVSRRVGQIFIEQAVQDRDITINGSGEEKLDFTYVDDLIQGTILTIEKEEAKNQTFNLTFGKARSISDMVNILDNYFPKLSINYVPKDNLIPDRGTLNVDKARHILGYKPQYDLEKGYVKYIEWYKDFYKALKESK